MDCFLVLEDGAVFRGRSFGAKKSVFGEIVFNTGMTGYQESLTDPSYRGQILTMSYPMIGNYGVNKSDYQSDNVHVRAFVVKEMCEHPSHRACTETLHDYLKRHEVPGIYGVDTRALITRIREHGTMRAALTYDADHTELVEKLKKMDYPSSGNLVAEVSCGSITHHKGGSERHVVLIDAGMKLNILRELVKRYTVTVVPYNTSSDDILKLKPDALFISNGPGDPAHPEIMATTVRTIKELSGELPIMGICLGHQLLGLAFGAKTFKLKFGHRGANQPVGMDGKVWITSQNHGYAVDAESLGKTGLRVTLLNQNDWTVEGMKHTELPIFSVQFHPEANPGPRDTSFLFDELGKLMEGRNAKER
ncbi:MAG: glutamine-hydrolyzing carbamoyl-phosphate synthase small subunit [Thermoplasmata archaeon]